MNKPKFFYHASQNKKIDIFEPRTESVRDPKEGPVVFATPDKVMASIFLVPTDDSWTSSGLFGDVHFFACGDESRFKQIDKGGAIYVLPPDTFENDPSEGLGLREWTSKVSVKPKNKEEYESGLEAMLSFGVQVYFLDKQEFQELLESGDHGNSILGNTESENSRRGINVKQLPQI